MIGELLIPILYPVLMFGPRITKVFASRGHALWWSAMVLVTAYCVAADPPAPVAPAPDAAAAAKDENKKEADPWAQVTGAGHAGEVTRPPDTWDGLRNAAKRREELLHRTN